MMSVQTKRHFVLTGPPGIGKTTIVKNVCSVLQKKGIPIYGFYTEELRKNGQRIGFDVVNVNGGRGPLARIDDSKNSMYKVGRYSVLLNEFESMVMPIFQIKDMNTRAVIIIDEIGKMEIYSESFKNEIRKLFENEESLILATIPMAKGKPLQIVESIRNNSKNKILNVDEVNRDKVTEQLLDSITKLL